MNMNWDQIEGRWTEMKGHIRAKWGELTDDELDQVAGKRDQMVGMLQRKYGYAREQAEKELDTWSDKI